ncbi:GAF domain-containing protein, partial [bacterium]
MPADRPLESRPQGVAALIRDKNWSATSVGPIQRWPSSLHTTLRLMVGSRFAMWLGWGPDLAFFYNDAYAQQTLGPKHPAALGRPFREVWSEIWDALEARIMHVLRTGEATWDEGLLLFLERSGYREETYHTFSYSPAPGDAPDEIAGLFCVVIEETERVLAERRMAHLRDLAAKLSQTNSEAGVFQALETTLDTHWKDIPFSIAYELGAGADSCRRLAQTHFPTGHPAAPEQLSITSSTWPLAQVLETGRAIAVPLDPANDWPRAGWDEPPVQALLVPMFRSGHDEPMGVFIAGITPHRPLDEGLRSFVQLVVGQLEAGLASARAYEEEKRRADALAELD